jgi:protease-4
MGKGGTGNIGGNYYASVLRKIREKGDYDALVLRINSPGGNAMASDMIWREVELVSKEMPVVVSMGNYAASGGYYIAAPATTIFAQPTTITGSIGVFGIIPQANELLEGKLGITTDAVNTNKYSDAPSFFRPMDEYETTIFQQNVDRTYDEFISRVSEGRQIEKENVDRMGQGQVYYGIVAIEKGLVDKTGGLMDALEEAASLASIESYRIVELPVIEDVYTKLLKSLGGNIKMKIIENELGIASKYYKDLNDLQAIKGIQARMPYFIDIK